MIWYWGKIVLMLSQAKTSLDSTLFQNTIQTCLRLQQAYSKRGAHWVYTKFISTWSRNLRRLTLKTRTIPQSNNQWSSSATARLWAARCSLRRLKISFGPMKTNFLPSTISVRTLILRRQAIRSVISQQVTCSRQTYCQFQGNQFDQQRAIALWHHPSSTKTIVQESLLFGYQSILPLIASNAT